MVHLAAPNPKPTEFRRGVNSYRPATLKREGTLVGIWREYSEPDSRPW